MILTTEWLDISDVTPRIAYTATAAQTAFVVPFIFFEDSNLKVYQNGVLKTLATHYTVAGAEAEAGGTVTLLTGATLADEIMIVREVPLEQTTHIPPSGPLDIPAINIQISKLVTMMQELDHGLARSIRLADNLPGELEIATPVASEFLKWNATADGIESAAVVTPDGTYAIATESEAVAGTLNNVLMTPLRVAQAATQVISDTGPFVAAWDFGVTGNEGEDQTAALQALFTQCKADGGMNLLVKGVIEHTALDAIGTINLKLIGFGVNGAGGDLSRTLMRTGSLATRILDLRGSVGFGAQDIYFYQTNTLALGKYVSFGLNPVGGAEAVFMTMDRCQISNNGFAGSAGLHLDGSTRGQFSNCNFYGGATGGAGVHGKDLAFAGFSNVHTFIRCNMWGGSGYPMINPHGGWTLIGCNFEASSADGLGRAIKTDSANRFEGLAIIGGIFGDVTAAGGQWMQLSGDGLTIQGILMDGGNNVTTATDGIVLDGCNGINICGNTLNYLNSAIAFNGVCAGGLIAANKEFSNTNFVSYFSSPTGVIVSRVDGSLAIRGLPTSAPAVTGGLWIDTAASRVIKSAP